MAFVKISYPNQKKWGAYAMKFYQIIKNPQKEDDYKKQLIQKNKKLLDAGKKPLNYNYNGYVKNPKVWVVVHMNQIQQSSHGLIVSQNKVANPKDIYNQIHDGENVYYFRRSVIGDKTQIHRWNLTTNETCLFEANSNTKGGE